MKGKLPPYPKDHPLGMRVPEGGSNCAKCKYVSSDGKFCSEPHFNAWNGSDQIPLAAEIYCCDFFESRTTRRTASDLRVKK